MMRPITRGLVALALGWCAGLLGAGTASAASTWLPAGNLRSPVPALSAQVATDPAGNSVAVWHRRDDRGDADPTNDNWLVEYAYRPAGGSFGAPQVLSGNLGAGRFRDAQDPDVAMDGRGRALVTWTYSDGTNSLARARVRGTDGSLGAIQDLMPTDAGMNVYGAPVPAVSPDGHAAVVWEGGEPSGIYATTGTLDDGLARATPVSGPNSASEYVSCPHVAIDDGGNALFAWQRNGDRSRRVEAVAGPGSGERGSVAVLSMNIPYKFSECPRVALDPRGRGTVVWSLDDRDPDFNGNPSDDDDRDLIQFVTRSAPTADWGNGTFSSAGVVPTLTESGNFRPDVVVDADNTAIVVWSGRDASDRSVIQAASRPSGGGFGNHQTLSGPGRRTSDPHVAIGANGHAVAMWLWSPGTGEVVQAAQRPAGTGTSFGTVAEQIDSAPSGAVAQFLPPEPAVDAEGNAIGAWVRTRLDGGHNYDHVPRFAGLDAAAPKLADIGVPGSAATGQTLAFSASALDRWSPTKTSWSFGDGRTADGASVEHAFDSPGIHTVTVTSTDDAGNTATATRTVQVHNPDKPAPASVVAPAGAPAPSGGVDSDRDGFFSNQDCDDANGAIRPNAQEVRGNRIDENCDGRADDYLAITSPLNWSWRVNGARAAITKLTARDIPSGATIELRCVGKRCPVKRKQAATPRGPSVDVLGALGGRRWHFRAGQTLEIRITAPERIGKVVRFQLQAGRIPRGKALCLRPAASRPAPCGR